jgi:hypothetical protein
MSIHHAHFVSLNKSENEVGMTSYMRYDNNVNVKCKNELSRWSGPNGMT